MANLYYAASYKNKIINLLLENQNFIKLINPVPSPHDELDIVDVLLGGEWIVNGEVHKEQGHIFAHKDIVRITDTSTPTVEEVKEMGYFVGNRANRIDVLCDIVDRILNGTEEIKGIGRVRPAARRYMTIYQPANEYYGKCLKYTISNYNDTDS